MKYPPEKTNRRAFLAAGSALSLSAISGCLGTLQSQLSTGSETTPERDEWSLGVRNDTDGPVTLTLTVRDDSGETTRFEKTFELSPGESNDTVFTVEEPTSSRIVANVDDGPKKMFTWKACAGYGSAVVFVYQNDGETGLGMRQPHGDPEAKQCSV